MKMIRLFGDLHAFFRVPQGLGKTTKMAQRQPEPCPRPSGKEGRWKGRPIRDPCAIGGEGRGSLAGERDRLGGHADCVRGVTATGTLFYFLTRTIGVGGGV